MGDIEEYGAQCRDTPVYPECKHGLCCRMEPVQLTFLVTGAGIGGIGLMVLVVGCLSTGSTRYRVYRTWHARLGGKITCAIVSTGCVCVLSFLSLLPYHGGLCDGVSCPSHSSWVSSTSSPLPGSCCLPGWS